MVEQIIELTAKPRLVLECEIRKYQLKEETTNGNSVSQRTIKRPFYLPAEDWTPIKLFTFLVDFEKGAKTLKWNSSKEKRDRFSELLDHARDLHKEWTRIWDTKVGHFSGQLR